MILVKTKPFVYSKNSSKKTNKIKKKYSLKEKIIE